MNSLDCLIKNLEFYFLKLFSNSVFVDIMQKILVRQKNFCLIVMLIPFKLFLNHSVTNSLLCNNYFGIMMVFLKYFPEIGYINSKILRLLSVIFSPYFFQYILMS